MIHYFKQPKHLLQLIILIITLAIGFQFLIHVCQASGVDTITVHRPPGVEGFLPIGALMGWKHLFLTGQWDRVHPAAMVIFGWAIVLSFLFRKVFCGWFCPIGTVSEWCWRLGGRLLGRNFRLPAWLDMPLRSLKYLLLGFFLWAISRMGIDQTTAFMNSPYYALSDVKMLHFFTRISVLTTVVLTILVIFSILTKNFWCRYLCPYGALAGLVAFIGPTRIRRNQETCTQCRLCDRACPSHLPVSHKASIKSPECIGCMDCIQVCPVSDTLALTTRGLPRRIWSPARTAIVIGLLFLMTVYAAEITGHWRSGLSEAHLRALLKTIDAPENTHPRLNF